MVVGHNWRGGTNLCIGAEGYNPDSFVALSCTKEDLERFPVGTLFDLVRSDEIGKPVNIGALMAAAGLGTRAR
jgi:hypothetical protein